MASLAQIYNVPIMGRRTRKKPKKNVTTDYLRTAHWVADLDESDLGRRPWRFNMDAAKLRKERLQLRSERDKIVFEDAQFNGRVTQR